MKFPLPTYQHRDHRAIGDLFCEFFDEVKQVDFIDALRSLLEMLEEIKTIVSKKLQELISSQLDKWIQPQPNHIKELLSVLVWES